MGTIRFGDQATDFCEPQLNLLAHAQALEIGIGSRCGGHGVCGGDVVLPRLDDGSDPGALLSPHTEDERRHLSSEQLTQGYRLACQCYPNRTDLRLIIEVNVEAKVTS